ncbi:shufflon system plasmid conjugative transfer pilus tip adhesin PilV [Cognatishimia sp. D5M38]|uniref:Shufflon system plasmid conjugative transfer pilus tip adhesin PilV n=1 Tax=Cognatishimia coralii TaxID=3083254 RepID=A0ABU8QKU1_9RHOB
MLNFNRVVNVGPRAPRKRRKGLGLVDAGFAVLLFTMTLPSVLEIIAQRQFEIAVLQEARQVGSVATQAALNFSSDFLTVASDTFNAANQMREHDIDTLMAGSSVALRAETSRRRPIRLISYAPSSDQLIVLAYASFSGTERTAAPFSAAGNVGWVAPSDPNAAVSEGLRLDLSAFQVVYTDLDVGDIVAVEYLSAGLNVDPYLHRVSVPGRTELNQMEVDLDLGGNSISDIGTLTAVELHVSGDLTTEQITGDLAVSGQFEVSGALISTGPITVSGDLNVANSLSAANLSVTNTISASNLTTDTLSTRTALMETMNVARDLRGDSVLADNFVASDATLGAVTGAQISIRNFGVSGVAQVDTVFTNSLSAGECTGC